MFRLKFILVLFLLLVAPVSAYAVEIVMLPPTLPGGGSTPCAAGFSQVLIYSGSNNDASGHPQSGINCINSIHINPSTGDFFIGSRLFSGGPGSGGMWADGVSQSQFFGSAGAADLGLYSNGNWSLIADNANNVYIDPWAAPGTFQVNGTVSILNTGWATDHVYLNSNQIWNAGGWLYLNYSAPAGNVVIGGGGLQQNLYVAQGDILVPSGGIQVGNTNNCTAGMIRWDGVTWWGCNGAAWVKFGGSGGATRLMADATQIAWCHAVGCGDAHYFGSCTQGCDNFCTRMGHTGGYGVWCLKNNSAMQCVCTD
jgi:hypothetical protein